MVHLDKDLGSGRSLIGSVHPGDIVPQHRTAVLGDDMIREGTRMAKYSPVQGKEPAGKPGQEKPTRVQPYAENYRQLRKDGSGRDGPPH